MAAIWRGGPRGMRTGGDVAQEGEFAAAVRAGEGLERGKLRQRFAELAEHRPDLQAGLAGGGTEEPVVPDPWQALGQDVEQPAPDQLVRVERHHAGLAAAAVGPGDADIAFLVVAEQALRRERAAPDVAGEVAQRGLAPADGLELDVPGFRGGQDLPLGAGECLVNVGMTVLDRVVEPAAEAVGERTEVDEEVVLGRPAEPAGDRMERDGRNDDIQKVRSRANRRGVMGTSRALLFLATDPGMWMTSRSPLMCLGLM
jgi:hypothetical protein